MRSVRRSASSLFSIAPLAGAAVFIAGTLLPWGMTLAGASPLTSTSMPTSCGSQGAEGSVHGPATISVAYTSTQEFNTNAQAAKWFKMLKSTFQRHHPGVTVKLIPIGGSEDDFLSKIELMLRSPSTAPDVIHENSEQVGGQVEAGQIAPLDGYLKHWDQWKYFPSSVRTSGVPGPHVWQMISGLWNFGLYYDVNQFRDAGLPVPWQPKSWAQVLAAAKRIKQKVPETTPLFVYAGSQLLDQTTAEDVLPLLQGTGSPVASGLRWVVKSPGLMSVFRLYHTIFADGIGPSASVLANPSADSLVNGTLMPKQKAAIVLAGSWFGSWWVPGGSSPWKKGAETYRVAALPTENGQSPGFATQAQGSTFVMTCASSHRRLAAALMELAESRRFNILHVLWTGEIPPRTDLLHSKRYLDSVPYYNAAQAGWVKHATFTPSYNYLAYATCMGQVTGEIEASSLEPVTAQQQFGSCMKRAVGPTGVAVSHK